MFSRLATANDLAQLRHFRCSPEDADYQAQVEGFIHDVGHWLKATPDGGVLVFFDEDREDAIVGVSIFGPYEPGSAAWFISAVAVALDRAGEGLGEVVLQTTIAEARDRQGSRPYGRCLWHVDVSNGRMRKMCDRLRYVGSPVTGGLIRYEVPIT